VGDDVHVCFAVQYLQDAEVDSGGGGAIGLQQDPDLVDGNPVR
jgi:hypothetical protein